MERGRDPRAAQQQGARPGSPYPAQAPTSPGNGNPRHQGAQQWLARGQDGGPEYFGPDGSHSAGPSGYPGHGGSPQYQGGYPNRAGHGSRDDDNPGSTRAFTIGDAPDDYPYQPQQGHPGYPGADGHVATYRAGQPPAPPAAPRLHWRELLKGIVLHPQRTFWQMRDYQVWGPALIVTLIYGVVAVFGFESDRTEILGSTLATSVPRVLVSGVAVVLGTLMLGAVTNALARQLGGDGSWAPTIGLSMIITALTDAPRLLFALFLPADEPLVQVLGWATWLLCAALLTSMVSKSHDLPWPRALGACSIQLVALLVLIKLPTLGS